MVEPDRGRDAGCGQGFYGFRSEIRADVADVLLPGSAGIVAMFEERWVDEVEGAPASAVKITKHEVDRDTAKEVTAAATGERAQSTM